MPDLPVSSAETFDFDGFSVRISHITDEQMAAFWRRSIAISEDGLFLMLSMRDRKLDFPRMHFVLQSLYGRSGRGYDSYKSSFAFPFSLDVVRSGRSYCYAMTVRNYRTWIEYCIRRGVEDAAQADNIIHEPCDVEFSRTEINRFIAHFYGYLQDCLQVLLAQKPVIQPFVYSIDSNMVLYGYLNGQFFERQYHDEHEFDADRRRYMDEVAAASTIQ